MTIFLQYYELNVSNVIEDVSFLDSRLSVQDTFKFKRTQIGPCFVANQYDVRYKLKN